MANVVLIIDMTRAFLEEGHPLFIGEEGRRIIPNVQGLLERELAKESKILYLCDNHDPDDLEFKMFPPHSIKGTAETEIIPEIAKYPGETISKRRYSAFFGTILGMRLEELKPEKVIICGVCTDICVLHTAGDTRDRDYAVEVPTDCVATFDSEAHKFALKHMERILGVKLIS